MTTADIVILACAAVYVVLLVALVLDRQRMKQQLLNAQGAVTGLALDLDATRARVEQLQSYLGDAASWAVDAVPPPDVADRRTPTRWTRTAPVPSDEIPSTEVSSSEVPSEQASSEQASSTDDTPSDSAAAAITERSDSSNRST